MNPNLNLIGKHKEANRSRVPTEACEACRERFLNDWLRSFFHVDDEIKINYRKLSFRASPSTAHISID